MKYLLGFGFVLFGWGLMDHYFPDPEAPVWHLTLGTVPVGPARTLAECHKQLIWYADGAHCSH